MKWIKELVERNGFLISVLLLVCAVQEMVPAEPDILQYASNIALLYNEEVSYASLIDAIHDGNQKAAQKFIDQKNGIGVCDARGISPLQYAIQYEYYDIAKGIVLAIQEQRLRKVYLNHSDGSYRTALHQAIAVNDEKMLLFLMHHGANVTLSTVHYAKNIKRLALVKFLAGKYNAQAYIERKEFVQPLSWADIENEWCAVKKEENKKKRQRSQLKKKNEQRKRELLKQREEGYATIRLQSEERYEKQRREQESIMSRVRAFDSDRCLVS